MLNEEDEIIEYDQDYGTLQVAVKIGILGIFIGLVSSILYVVDSFIWYELNGSMGIVPYRINLFNQINFIAALLGSVGYTAVFAMKNIRLGIVFTLLAIINSYGFRVYTVLLWELGFYSGDLIMFSAQVIGYVNAIIIALVLLTLRKRVNNIKLLYLIIFFALCGGLLGSAIFYIMFGATSVQITSSVVYLLTQIPSLVIRVTSAILIIVFFIVESRKRY